MRIALASILGGQTVTDTTRFLNLAGAGHYSDATMREIIKESREIIEDEASKVFEEELQLVRKEYGNLLDLKVNFKK